MGKLVRWIGGIGGLVDGFSWAEERPKKSERSGGCADLMI